MVGKQEDGELVVDDKKPEIRRGRRETGRGRGVSLKLNEKQVAKLKFYSKARNQSMSAFVADFIDKVPNILEILALVEGENEEEDRLAA
ncbi:MAG: hypothetical protein HC815_30890 [Richelia sp. RM1_1_1]|nr:hypothetical protein [Richelia sp. RM1_1_1]